MAITALRKDGRCAMREKLLTTDIIRKEYALQHSDGTNVRTLYEECKLLASDFPIADLQLALDDFSRKQGWMK